MRTRLRRQLTIAKGAMFALLTVMGACSNSGSSTGAPGAGLFTDVVYSDAPLSDTTSIADTTTDDDTGGVTPSDTLAGDVASDAGDADGPIADATVADAQTTDTETADTKAADTTAADTQLADTQTADTAKADTQTADTQVADTQAADTQTAPECGPNKPCAFPEVCASGKCAVPPPLPYPTRTAWQGKSIQPDFWANKDELVNNGVGGVAMNLVWAQWQPSPKAPPCAPAEVTWKGGCYTVPKAVDDAIGEWSAKGLTVTAVVYGPPPWARVAKPACSPAGPGFDWFCAPTDHAAYGRFAGLLAQRYDGQHGHGRVIDFVIHNEVNSNIWYDVGCGGGKACDTKAWLDSYAESFKQAYDAIVAVQPEARVLISLDHHFGKQWDQPSKKSHPLLSGISVIKGVDARVGKRKWRVAMHPYPPNLLAPGFSEFDYNKEGKITYGSLGVFAGWLRKHFPNKPWTHEIHLTESGVNSLDPQSNEAAQEKGVCDALRAGLGTPGVVNHIYHRMTDHPDETKGGLGLGLRRADKSAKPAWKRWAHANRKDLSPPQLDCGYEDLPYIRLRRGFNSGAGHWATTRNLPPGYAKETDSWRLMREPKAGAKLLYACRVGTHNLISPDVGCEGLPPLGPVGWAWQSKPPKGVPIYRCRIGKGEDHFVSSSPTCEGQVVESLLGYGLP